MDDASTGRVQRVNIIRRERLSQARGTDLSDGEGDEDLHIAPGRIRDDRTIGSAKRFE